MLALAPKRPLAARAAGTSAQSADHIHGISYPLGAELFGCECDFEKDNAMMPRTVEVMAGNKSIPEMQPLKVDVTTHEGH